jgi:ribose transport system substrate-binding protein
MLQGRAHIGLVRALISLAFALAVVFAATGCGAKSNKSASDSTTAERSAGSGQATPSNVPRLEGKKVGIAGLSTQDFFSRSAYEGAIARVKELGGEPIAVSAEQDAQKLVANLENLISQKPAAIISHGKDPKTNDPIYRKVRAAGIPLFTIDTPSKYSISNSEADNYAVGSQVAIALAQSIGGKGNVLVFNAFSKSLRVLGIRYNQLLEVLKDYPEIRLLKPELEDVVVNSTEDARKKTQDALQKYPKGKISAIWGGWDLPMIGAAKAVDAAGRDEIKVFGVNGDPAAVSMIEGDSSFTADAGIRAFAIGETAVDNVARYVAGQRDAIPQTAYVSPVLITKQNVAQAKAELAGKGSAPSDQ